MPKGLSVVAYTDGTRRQSMDLIGIDGINQFVLRLKRGARKGHQFWQYDGFCGSVTVLRGNPEVKSNTYYPKMEERDGTFRQIHDIFIKPQSK